MTTIQTELVEQDRIVESTASVHELIAHLRLTLEQYFNYVNSMGVFEKQDLNDLLKSAYEDLQSEHTTLSSWQTAGVGVHGGAYLLSILSGGASDKMGEIAKTMAQLATNSLDTRMRGVTQGELQQLLGKLRDIKESLNTKVRASSQKQTQLNNELSRLLSEIFQLYSRIVSR